MKKFTPVLVYLLTLLPSSSWAQWQNVTYSLKAGWNTIYLHGDANHDTIDNLLVGAPAVQEVWRWNPNPNPAQFRTSSMLPTASTPEWSVWIRGNTTQTTLSSLLGQTAYLIKCSAPATYTGTIPADVVNGTYTLNVSFAGGSSLTWGNFVVDRNATSSTPSIAGVSSNVVGTGVQFTISGVNFPTSGTTVITLVNGTTTVATLTQGIAGSATSTQISATVPVGTAAGTYTLKVAFASGVTLYWNNFTVGTAAPTTPLLTAVTPNPIMPGAELSFSGINFPAGLSPVVTLVNSSGATVATISGLSFATAYQLTIPQRILPPRSTWMRGSANFLGFPSLAGTDAPTLGSYFATFPVAIASNARVYKYVGGEIGASNPLQIYSTATEKMDRNQAYWFEASVVGDFSAPLEVKTSDPDGVVFGRSTSFVTFRLRNRTSSAMTVTLTPENSAAVPVAYASAQTSLPSGSGTTVPLAPVPLIRRTYTQQSSATTGQLETVTTDTAITGAFTETIAPLSELQITIGADRARMTADAGTIYASFLRIKDATKMVDIPLPISARTSSLAGLWVGDVQVSRVDPMISGKSYGASTSRSFPLRMIVHVDANGVVRLLSQVYIGKIAGSAAEVGLSTRESSLQADQKAAAVRLSSGHLPLDLVLSATSGSFALGSFVDFGPITLAYNSPTNPFVHTYHPDHDNRDAKFVALGSGVESYNVSRSLRFTFYSASQLLAADPASASWGASKMVGGYVETITGLRRDPIVSGGTFELRRISEIAELTDR
jgi:hypothetical protein